VVLIDNHPYSVFRASISAVFAFSVSFTQHGALLNRNEKRKAKTKFYPYDPRTALRSLGETSVVLPERVVEWRQGTGAER
jgi:hypothetical protein